MRIPSMPFLHLHVHLQRQAVHAATHVHVPSCDPALQVRWQRYHRRAFNVAATKDTGTAAVTFAPTPLANSTTITGPSDRLGV